MILSGSKIAKITMSKEQHTNEKTVIELMQLKFERWFGRILNFSPLY